jgi:cellulose synthase/poly-beta-1,6-N-acetylglucosamine synthase-like glycosyltransferase
MNDDLRFSIAVCTYNPNIGLLKRLLTSLIEIVRVSEQEIEIVIVDNNSSPPLSCRVEIQDFFLQVPHAKCVVENVQGLAAARCRAIRTTDSPIVVFFDDDNEPSADYIKVLSEYFSLYPKVGIWGPGLIRVEYTEPVDWWFQQHPEKFQQRHSPLAYSCELGTWKKWYPNGTGFAIRRDILDKYLSSIETGLLSMTGRNGSTLASAEDVQIVWEGIKLGYGAGLIPTLSCNHLIPASKANIMYLRRLSFGITSSYMPALLQSFPDQKRKIHLLPSRIQVYLQLKIISLKMTLYKNMQRELQLEIAEYVGNICGIAFAKNSPRKQELLDLAKSLDLL